MEGESVSTTSAGDGATCSAASDRSEFNWTTNHTSVNKYVAAYFNHRKGNKLFRGKVMKFSPETAPGKNNEFYHILWEDDDEEDYNAVELKKGMLLYNSYNKSLNTGKIQELPPTSIRSWLTFHHSVGMLVSEGSYVTVRGKRQRVIHIGEVIAFSNGGVGTHAPHLYRIKWNTKESEVEYKHCDFVACRTHYKKLLDERKVPHIKHPMMSDEAPYAVMIRGTVAGGMLPFTGGRNHFGTRIDSTGYDTAIRRHLKQALLLPSTQIFIFSRPNTVINYYTWPSILAKDEITYSVMILGMSTLPVHTEPTASWPLRRFVIHELDQIYTTIAIVTPNNFRDYLRSVRSATTSTSTCMTQASGTNVTAPSTSTSMTQASGTSVTAPSTSTSMMQASGTSVTAPSTSTCITQASGTSITATSTSTCMTQASGSSVTAPSTLTSVTQATSTSVTAPSTSTCMTQASGTSITAPSTSTCMMQASGTSVTAPSTYTSMTQASGTSVTAPSTSTCITQASGTSITATSTSTCMTQASGSSVTAPSTLTSVTQATSTSVTAPSTSTCMMQASGTSVTAPSTYTSVMQTTSTSVTAPSTSTCMTQASGTSVTAPSTSTCMTQASGTSITAPSTSTCITQATGASVIAPSTLTSLTQASVTSFLPKWLEVYSLQPYDKAVDEIIRYHRNTNNHGEFVDDFLKPPCRVCGSKEHPTLQGKMQTKGAPNTYDIYCPLARLQELDLQPCPLKLAKACGYSKLTCESTLKDIALTGWGSSVASNTFLQFKKQVLYFCYADDVMSSNTSASVAISSTSSSPDGGSSTSLFPGHGHKLGKNAN